MTTLAEAINDYPVEWSHSEVFNAVRARTVTAPGTTWGANVQSYLATLGLVGLVKDTAEDAQATPGFRDVCIGLMARSDPDGQIDFSQPIAVGLLDVFFDNAGVQAILSEQSVTAEEAKATVLAISEETNPEFPLVTLRQIIEIREPALAEQQISSELTLSGLSGRSVTLLATIGQAPEPINPVVEIQHVYGELSTVWRGSAVSGFVGIQDAGTYRFTLPGELISAECKVRVKVPYSIGVSVTNG